MMKKNTLLLIAAGLLLTFPSFAQLSLGLKGGINLNTNSIDAIASSGGAAAVAQKAAALRTGWHLGAYAVVKLGGIALQPEAYYSVQGSDISLSNVKGVIESSYLQVPILLRFDLLEILNLHVGPQFGITLKNEYKDNAGALLENLKSKTQALDFSIAAGAGVELPLGFHATLRYVLGLTNSLKTKASTLGGGTNAINVMDWKNSMFQISVGYTLFGKK